MSDVVNAAQGRDTRSWRAALGLAEDTIVAHVSGQGCDHAAQLYNVSVEYDVIGGTLPCAAQGVLNKSQLSALYKEVVPDSNVGSLDKQLVAAYERTVASVVDGVGRDPRVCSRARAEAAHAANVFVRALKDALG